MHKKSLIIGINNYRHFSALENCINDAEDMHAFLSENGFDSTLLRDSTQAELIKAIAEFKRSISENTVSLIFFSGHGLQDEKYNYLVASDTEIRILEDIKYNCILADDLLIGNTKTNLHLIVLDACRNNPFYSGIKSGSIGLLKMNAPAGTLIAFSTSPHSTSIERAGERNGVYTRWLLKNMQTPNLPAELVFKNTRNDVMKDTSEKQIPWEESSLYGDHFSFIRTEEETISKLVIDHLLEARTILLPELLPFLNTSTFASASLEELIFILTLLKISFSNEQEGVSSRTMDEDYFDHIMIDNFYPIFQERLIYEDTSTEPFEIEIFDRIAIAKDVNFGYNWLDAPDESFPQIVANYIKFDEKDGILCFYLSPQNDEHLLKPALFTITGNQIDFFNYAIIKGAKVNEIIDCYFKIREPFEKKSPDLESYFTIEEIDEEGFEKLFKRKK